MRQKLIHFIILFLLCTVVSAQDIVYNVIHDTYETMPSGGAKYFYIELHKGEVLMPAFAEPDFSEGLFVGFHIPTDDRLFYVDAKDVIIPGSDTFDPQITYDENKRFDYQEGWVPTYYIDVLKAQKRDRIFDYEPSAKEFAHWNERNGFRLTIFFLQNLGLSAHNACVNGYSFFIFKNLKKLSSTIYQVHAVAKIANDKYEHPSIADDMRQYTTGDTYTFIIQQSGNRLRIYKEGESKPTWELFKASADFTKRFNKFVETNSWPDYEKCLPVDINNPWPALDLTETARATQPTSDKTSYTSSNLRLRSEPSTKGNIVITLPKGSSVTILKNGPSDIIDGITSHWVQVQTSDGKIGWCFGAYLYPLP